VISQQQYLQDAAYIYNVQIGDDWHIGRSEIGSQDIK